MKLRRVKTKICKRTLLFTALLVICSFLMTNLDSMSQAQEYVFKADNDASSNFIEYVPGHVMVAFKPGTDQLRIDTIVDSAGATVKEYWKEIDVYLLKVPSLNIADTVSYLSIFQEVEFSEPDFIIKLDEDTQAKRWPNDPYFRQKLLWGLHNTGQRSGRWDADIDAPEAWGRRNGTGSRNVIVAVIDSGVDRNHPDLRRNMWVNWREKINGRDDDGNGYVDDRYGWDFVYNDNDPMDYNSHGTHVAGTIGAVSNNRRGVTGVAWQVRIMALRFLDANGSGSTSNAIKAINYSTRKRAHISNNSWGGGGYSVALKRAITRYAGKGGLFIAAAGNSSSNNDRSPHYPSNYNNINILAVAATDNRDQLASFSNYGIRSVDVAAPGVDILSTEPFGRYGYKSGTSMAAPHVAGVAALVKARHPNWGYYKIKQRIMWSGDWRRSLKWKVKTKKRVNAYKANR